MQEGRKASFLRRGRKPRNAEQSSAGMEDGGAAEAFGYSEPRILRREVSREEVLEAIPGSYGLATTIAERLGCTINAVKSVLDEGYDDISHAIADEAEHQEDLIVKSIIDDAKGGDVKARELYLKMLASRHSPSGGRSGGGQQISVRFSMQQPPAVSPDTKGREIETWGRQASEAHREQVRRAENADIDGLLADATRMRPIDGGGV